MTKRRLQKSLIVLVGMWICLAAWAGMASAETGVAFVHGTGSQTDAYNDYWTSDFVDSVRSGLENPDNFVVVNCNFKSYFWKADASGCLAEYLHNFIIQKNIDSLVVITHSHGGNMMRWILSNPTWDSRYPAIIKATRWVNALAPSSGGTELADAVKNGNSFESSLGWVMGYDNEAVEQQQTAWMEYYNNNWLYGTEGRPELPVDFWAVVGTDVQTAVWDQDSFCGGYQLNLGLEVTQSWLDSCSDGFLSCKSQSAAGKVWFRDVDYTEGAEPLSHAQSRRDCFGLDRMLRDDLRSLR